MLVVAALDRILGHLQCNAGHDRAVVDPAFQIAEGFCVELIDIFFAVALADLFGSADFPAEVLDPERAAEIVIQRLTDAGFEIKPAERYRP
jgi:hypothetical protein